jgi:hypothetical protein
MGEQGARNYRPPRRKEDRENPERIHIEDAFTGSNFERTETQLRKNRTKPVSYLPSISSLFPIFVDNFSAHCEHKAILSTFALTFEVRAAFSLTLRPLC